MSTIRKAIDNCDASNEMEALIKEQLETLIQLAEKNAEIDEANIQQSLKDGKINDDLFVPISKVIECRKEARAVTTESSADIVTKISESISKFFNPGKQEILDGISGILGEVVESLMGSGEGMELKQTAYVVAVEYPAVVRFDFAVWVRNTRAKGIRTKCKNAISVVAYKSAVDISKLDFATFVSVYSSLLSKSFGNNLKDVDTMLDAAENIYRRLGLKTDSVKQVEKKQLQSAEQNSVPAAVRMVKPYALEKLRSAVQEKKAEVGDF